MTVDPCVVRSAALDALRESAADMLSCPLDVTPRCPCYHAFM